MMRSRCYEDDQPRVWVMISSHIGPSSISRKDVVDHDVVLVVVEHRWSPLMKAVDISKLMTSHCLMMDFKGKVLKDAGDGVAAKASTAAKTWLSKMNLAVLLCC